MKITYRIVGFFVLFFTHIQVEAQWSQQGSDINGEAAGDFSGSSISLSADALTLAIGAFGNDANGSYSGHVRVYNYNSGTWVQIGSDLDGDAASDYFGFSVSLSDDGSVLAVGAQGHDANGTNSGLVRVFKNNMGTWTQIGSDILGETPGDEFGFAISLSGDGTILAVGAPKNDASGTDSGHVQVYQLISGEWNQIGQNINGTAANDQFGTAISLSTDGTTVAIGAYLNDQNGLDSGHVRVFKYTSGSWVQQGANIGGGTVGDGLGASVSINANGSILAVGAPKNDGNGSDSGRVYVYRFDSGSWVQTGQSIDGENPGDNLGVSVSLSDDGSYLAVGAPKNDGNGADSGHVRVYQFISGTWTQEGNDIDGEMAGDKSGTSISLNSDGTTVSIGAPSNGGNGLNSGHVRVFSTITLKVDDNNFGDQFSLYPNPADSNIKVHLGDRYSGVVVKVHNLLGQLLFKKNYSNVRNFELPINNEPGVYFVRIQTEEGKNATVKVIKK